MSTGRAKTRARREFTAARNRYEDSWIHDLVTQLKALNFADWTTIFGAELLWSALPFIILLSSLADERVDDDLSRHIGLDLQASTIVRKLFRNHPTHAVEPILTGLLFAFAGIIMVVSSLQVLCERAFDQDHRGWRDLPRFVVWVAVLLGALTLEGALNRPVRSALGPVVPSLLGCLVDAIFFAWTMHFLLAGRTPWRSVIRPAVVTAVLWLCLSVFSSIYFSPLILEDTRLYGKIGVVFTLLSWFILVGAVIVLGTAIGAVWQRRRGRAVRTEHGVQT